jgi:hypothetical protein
MATSPKMATPGEDTRERLASKRVEIDAAPCVIEAYRRADAVTP